MHSSNNCYYGCNMGTWRRMGHCVPILRLSAHVCPRGAIWYQMGPYSTIWHHVGLYGPIWTIWPYMAPHSVYGNYGAIWCHAMPYRPYVAACCHLVHYWAKWCHMVSYGAIWGHIGPHGWCQMKPDNRHLSPIGGSTIIKFDMIRVINMTTHAT